MKKHKLGLSTRTFVILVSLSAVFLLATILIQTAFFGTFYARTKKQEINDALRAVLEEISGDASQLQDSCDEIAHYYNVCILVTDENMNTLASAEGAVDCELMRLSTNALRTLYENAKNNGGTYTKEIESYHPQFPDRFDGQPENRREQSPGNTLLKVNIVSTDGGMIRVVFINSLITPVKNMTDSLRTQLIVLACVMLVLSLVLSLIYSRQLSKPIIEMNNEADKLAKGDFDVHFEQDSGSRELDELGGKLNYAASELSKVNALRTELI
ncbi:MAG: HAMP domain-containing protein, partial [Oscillospiraceae bacterium]|nr:HAMP domain-containing protein [Oscillospiraceae bacterium]